MAVYLSEYIYPEAVETLKEKVSVVDTFDKPEEIEAIILRNIPVTAELMDRCKNLKVIAKHGVGVNTIDLAAAKERGILVTNTPTANSNSVAELIVALTLDACRNVTRAYEKTREGEFASIAPAAMTGMELTGKTLGLVGTGNIARMAAKILQGGFGMKVVGYDPYVSKENMEKMGYEKYETVQELIAVSDVINVSVPLTDSTRNLISGDVFKSFKKGAVLINAARGGIVNEDDLYEALKEKTLRAAACDAFVTEPPTAKTSKLFELDNFIGTPHIGACAEEALERMGTEVVEEVLRVLSGADPLHRVV